MKRTVTFRFQLLNWNNRCQKPTNLRWFGPVHYQLLTHLTDSALSVLVTVYNHLWESGRLPPSWREAVVIPIPKPVKTFQTLGISDPLHLAAVCAKRWRQWLTLASCGPLSQSLLSEKQCGFRKYHSTLDRLDRFETFIRKAFVNKGHARLSLSLKRPTQRGSKALWQTSGISVSGASSLCLFRASCPNVLLESEWAPLCQSCTMGVRQGSILSPALFSIKVKNSVNAVLKGTDCSLFVDDFALCVCGGGGGGEASNWTDWKGLWSCALTAFKTRCLRTIFSSPL